MKKKEMSEKEWLLDEIEELLKFSNNDTVDINQNYLDFFSLRDLYYLKDTLEKNRTDINKNNLEWLKTFKN